VLFVQALVEDGELRLLVPDVIIQEFDATGLASRDS